MLYSVKIDRKTLAALTLEWLAIAGLITLAVRADTFWLYIPAGIVIATRQHALLILFHDAVHGHLASRPAINDALINLFAGVPALLPVEFYRPLHLLHHRSVGTEQDPERRLLYCGQDWDYQPLPTAVLLRQLLGDLLLVNGIRTIRAWTASESIPHVRPVTLLIAILWIAALLTFLYSAPLTAIKALLLWFVPLLTLTQLLQKIRSFAEHSGGPGRTPGWPHWTYSWRTGLAGRLTIWPYNINYHREHHDNARLRWHELPGSGHAEALRLDGSQLPSLLHRR